MAQLRQGPLHLRNPELRQRAAEGRRETTGHGTGRPCTAGAWNATFAKPGHGKVRSGNASAKLWSVRNRIGTAQLPCSARSIGGDLSGNALALLGSEQKSNGREWPGTAGAKQRGLPGAHKPGRGPERKEPGSIPGGATTRPGRMPSHEARASIFLSHYQFLSKGCRMGRPDKKEGICRNSD